MGSHDGAVEHGVLIVGILRQGLEYPLPNPGARPTREAGVHYAEIAKAFRQVTPRDPSPVAVDNRLDKQSVIPCRHPNRTGATGQEIFNAIPLIVTQGVAALCHHGALRSFDSDGWL
jgi:hypothetical protein